MAVLLLLQVTVCPSLAHAHHTSEQRITDRTAYTLPQGGFRIGVFRADFPLFDSFSVRTYFVPWVFRMPNLMLKWRIYGQDPWAFAIDSGFYAFDTKSLRALDNDLASARILAVPTEVTGTYRFSEEQNLSASLVYTAVFVEGESVEDSLSGVAEGAVETGQFTTTYQWTLDRIAALQFTGRLVLLQQYQAAADLTFKPDEYTTVEVIGDTSGEQADLVGKGSVQADIVFSWKRANLRLGAGYGHYTLPGINFVLTKPGPYPSFDFYFIF